MISVWVFYCNFIASSVSVVRNISVVSNVIIASNVS